MRRHPTAPRGGGAMLCLGLHLYFPLVLLYQCQHGKIGAKTGAALLNYNKKSCQGCRRLGTLAQHSYHPVP